MPHLPTIPSSLHVAYIAGVVPQHPFLFDGSITQNLDPSGRHAAAELAATLRTLGLWRPLLAQLPGAQPSEGGMGRGEEGATPAAAADERSLERRVLALALGEGAAALSQGQQQLLALGRVLLQRPRLVLLDEATSSVDPATADAIHQVWTLIYCIDAWGK